MDYFEFEKDFKKKIGQLKLPRGAELLVPLTTMSTPFGWTVEFFISFSDAHHIMIFENYSKLAGLYASRKLGWAYHYGPVTPGQLGSDGSLTKGSCTDPLVIRIDTARIGLHLHFNSQNPHYKQSEVAGLDLEDIDCWKFIKGVLKHRQSGKSVDEVFGFKIKN